MKRRTKQDWSEIFALQELSGLDQRSFCEREGISYHAFRGARCRRDGKLDTQPLPLARRSRSQQGGLVLAEMCNSAGFLPVELAPEPTSEPTFKTESPDLTVELPYGVTLRFHGLGR